jgi:polyphosphate kinase
MDLFRAKEISWLAFNERVLQEAENPELPLIERFKFLGIYSNNLDEFFRVRVATLKRLAEIGGAKVKKIIGDDPAEVLKEVNSIVLKQRIKYENLQKSLFKELEKDKIYLVNEENLPLRQRNFALEYFYRSVRPLLMPVMIDQVTKFPDLEDEAIYFATILHRPKKEKERYSIIKLPTRELSRFLVLPRKGENKFIIFIDDVIRLGLKDLFSVYNFDSTEAYTIKLTKDAELDIDDDLGESYVKKVSKGLKRREEGDPVRLVYDGTIPQHLLEILKERIGISKEDTAIAGGRYHNLKDLMQIPNLGGSSLVYDELEEIKHPDISRGESIFSSISKKDILLHFPYHSFENFTDLLREASIDPKVKSIQISLYRLAEKSTVIKALVNALRNGKSVTAVVELTARFNERSNIQYSNLLREEGARVIYGVQGLKVHAKICQIRRQESGSNVFYTAIGTGNFNEDTGKVFSDIFILTKNEAIGKDIDSVFNFINRNYQIPECKHILPSPFSLRSMIEKNVQREMENAGKGLPAYVHFKLNNLVDRPIIQLLFDASAAGVEVRLNVRGMFAPILAEGLKETENISAIGIIDRHLEHSRILFFCNNGREECFISSADLMTRNLDRRGEITCPVLDPDIHNTLRRIFDLQWNDNVKSRILDADLNNLYRKNNMPPLRSQIEIHKMYLGR